MVNLQITAPVTPPAQPVACDGGYITSLSVDGSKIFAGPPTASITVRPFATNNGNPLVADASAARKFKTSDAFATGGRIPEVATFEAALYAMGSALITYANARAADLATVQAAQATAETALTAAQADQATKDAAARAAQTAVGTAHKSFGDGSPEVAAAVAASKAAADALAASKVAVATAQAAFTAASVKTAAAQAALEDFGKPPVSV